MNIGIVGVGLLGGSLAKILKQVYDDNVRISAFSSPKTLEKAKETGIYSNFYTYDQLTTETSKLDFVFLCSPIKVILRHIETLAQAQPFEKTVIVTDIGSTKKHIMSVAKKAFAQRDDICFIGGHPMTGNEFRGIEAADPLLYENAVYILTPPETAPNQLIEKILLLVKAIKAIPILLEPEKHDSIVTGISHLPQMLATGLADFISKEDNPMLSKRLSAGGLRDMTRIASSQFRMWEDIVDTNKDNILDAIDRYKQELDLLKNAIETQKLEAIFKNARETREGMPKGVGKGLLMPVFEVKIRVQDEPGTLLKISTILAENYINIKDLSMQSNREFEGGHFLLGFESVEAQEKAVNLLSEKGYFVRKMD